MAIPATDFAHVRLTVSDIDRSRAFYDSVFGFDVAMEAPPADADQETKDAAWWLFGGVVYSFPGGILGLRPVAPGDDDFDADRVGLDHLSLAVASVSDLEDAAAKLDGLGVAHEQIKDIGMGSILEFKDPDGIALELFAPASQA